MLSGGNREEINISVIYIVYVLSTRTRSLSKMATLSLKISLEGGKVVKTIQFEPSTAVYDACRIIREKILEASHNDREYSFFYFSC